MSDGDDTGRHFHPKVTVLVYKRDPDRSKPVHYPLQTLKPDAGLGIGRTRSEKPDGLRVEKIYRDIHSHDGSGKLHVEARSSGFYTLCDLIALWSKSPEFRKLWQNTSGGGAIHMWIDGYHVRRISLEKLLQVPLNHNMSITICIEISVPV